MAVVLRACEKIVILEQALNVAGHQSAEKYVKF